MAESVTIARPYAEALFRAAKESGNLAKWAEQLALLAQVAANPEVREAIGDRSEERRVGKECLP